MSKAYITGLTHVSIRPTWTTRTREFRWLVIGWSMTDRTIRRKRWVATREEAERTKAIWKAGRARRDPRKKGSRLHAPVAARV